MLVHTRLRYLKWDERYKREKPYQINSHIPGLSEHEKSNLSFESVAQSIADIRGQEDEFTLDTNGFQVLADRSPPWDFTQGLTIKAYYDEIETILKGNIEGVDKVFCFDYRVGCLLKNGVIRHGLTVVATYSDPRSKPRSVWRPYDHIVEDFPLAVCDPASMNENEFVRCDQIMRTYIGETIFPLYNSTDKWYFLSNHSPDELLLLKIYDSASDVKANCCPHSSFQLNNVSASARPRKSVEVRALVFTYPCQ
ncbi:unnamed protein product [Penicillium salamii]|nr:unnamed protein product [Penicillium salamii]CAG8364193.1 unnamed protein product [Penicillium salamii]